MVDLDYAWLEHVQAVEEAGHVVPAARGHGLPRAKALAHPLLYLGDAVRQGAGRRPAPDSWSRP